MKFLNKEYEMSKLNIEEMKESILHYTLSAGLPEKAYHDAVDGKTDEEIEKIYKDLIEDK